MADFTGTTTVSVAPQAAFDYLSAVGNLPRYFARMTSAQPGNGAEVRTTATMPDGTAVQGDAWFTVQAEERRIEWGSEGPSEYAGKLQVTPSGAGSRVNVQLHTTRAPAGDGDVQDGVDETLAKIKEQLEA